jgi:hypothetical protein
VDNEKIGEDLITLAAVVERQQAAVQTAIDGLSGAKVALDKQLAVLQEAIPMVRQAAEEGAIAASNRALSAMQSAAASALNAGSGPVIARLDAVVTAAGNLEGKLQAVVSWFSWRLAGRLGLIFGAGVLVAWLLGWGSVLWHERGIKELRAQQQVLTDEVQQLRVRGIWLKAVDCEPHGGPKGRKCLPIDVRHLYGDPDAGTVLVWPVP